jgi:MFS family permease
VSAVALLYTMAMAIESVAMPLVALRAGYSKPAVGVLTAVSAVTQLLARLGSAPAMRRLPDRTLVVVSNVVLAASALLLSWSAAPAVFVGAELVQGVSRGLFWTGAQTHMVRRQGTAVQRMAAVTFVSSFGQVVGPVVAGGLGEVSYTLALWVSAGVAVVAGIAARTGMERLPVFEPVKGRMGARLWRRRPVRAACWASVTAGAWRSLVNSYLPVVVKQAGQTSAVVGVVVAVANAGNIAGSGVAGALRRPWVMAAGVVVTGAGFALCGVTAAVPAALAVVCGVSGVGAGALQTLGPAVAAGAVDADEQGDAVVLCGAFRAVALFGAPLGAAALLEVAELPAVLTVAGVLLALPAWSASRVARRPEP